MTALQMFIELSELIFAMNEREDRNAFIEFSGHVNWISVKVHTKGSYDQESPDYREELINERFYADQEDRFCEVMEMLRKELENELL